MTVSREWQTVIEQHNFSRIKLTLGSRLANFGSMLHRNRALYDTYIWFCLELQAYDCSECEPRDHDEWGLSHEDNLRIVKGLEDLFSTLSSWEPRRYGEMLQLDISVHSPSDSKHWYKYLTFEPDLPQEKYAFPFMDKQSMLDQPEYEGHKHGWRAGRPVSLPSLAALEKTFDEIMDLGPFEDNAQDMEWWRHLPLMRAITSLLLRQQTRRRWKPEALTQLFSRFPNLQEIHYEPWRELSDGMQGITDEWFQLSLESLSSSQLHLQRLVLFENFAPDYQVNTILCSSARIVSPNVSHAICSASLGLEQLSASFIVEASHFFQLRLQAIVVGMGELEFSRPDYTAAPARGKFNKDRGYALRSSSNSQENAKAREYGDMERKEGFSHAAQLPDRRFYSRPGILRSAVITWKGTWTHAIVSRLQSNVTDAWEAVARQQNSVSLTSVEETLSESDANRIKSHGDAIHYLNLSSPVIRPISLRQIRMEQMIRDGGHD